MVKKIGRTLSVSIDSDMMSREFTQLYLSLTING